METYLDAGRESYRVGRTDGPLQMLECPIPRESIAYP